MDLAEQLSILRDATVTGDIDLITKVMNNPSAVSMEEQRTVAEKLGFKKGLLSAATNIASDPLVWVSMMLSAKFPTGALINGFIPTRMHGLGAEMGGISKAVNAFKTMSGRYNKTLIPRLISNIVDRRAKVMKLYKRYQDIAEEHPNWKEDSYYVSLLLDGQTPAGARPELRKTAVRIRNEIMDPLWKLLEQTHHIDGGDLEAVHLGKGYASSMTHAEAAKQGLRGPAPEHIRDYLLHAPVHLHSKDALFELSAARGLERLQRGVGRQLVGATTKDGKVGPWKMDQFGRAVSDWTEYQHFTGTRGHRMYGEGLYRRTRDIPINAQMGSQDVFVLDLDYLMGKMFSDGARTYSLTAPMSINERAAVALRTKAEDGTLTSHLPTDQPPLVQIINLGVDTAFGGHGQRGTGKGATVLSKRIADPGGPKTVGTKLDMGPHTKTEIRSLQTLVRDLKGMSSDQDIMYNMLWEPIMLKGMRDLQKKFGKRKADEIGEAMQATFDRADFRKKANMLTTLTYYGTMGWNFGSTLTNSMQMPITTMPGIGVGYTIAGAAEVGQRVKRFAVGGNGRRSALMEQYDKMPKHMTKYEKLRGAWDKAFTETFPEMDGIHVARPEAFDLDTRVLDRQSPKGQKAAKLIDRVNNFVGRDDVSLFVMAPFTTMEFMNKAVTTYGARKAYRKAYADGSIPAPKVPVMKNGKEHFEKIGLDHPMMDEIVNFEARQFMRESQMPPMPGARTQWQYTHLNPMTRMFQGFATRLYNHYADSTVKGALTNAEMEQYRSLDGILNAAKAEGPMKAAGGAISANLAGGRNLGTMARTYMYSSILVNGLRDTVGVNMDRALGLTSSIPTAPDWQPFAPLPVPPIVGQVYGTMEALATRDIDKMRPLDLGNGIKIPVPRSIVPGGTAVSRFFNAWSQFSPDLGGRVDEDERLIYTASHLDTFLASLGVPLEKARHEKLAMQRIRDNRSAIRDLRRKFMVARSNMDYDTMNSIQAQHKKLFPDMPPISTDAKYLNIYKANQQRSRVLRMIKTMGAAAPGMEQDILDIHPELYTQPKPQLPAMPLAAGIRG